MEYGQVSSRIRPALRSARLLLLCMLALVGVGLIAAGDGAAEDVAPATRFAVGSPAMQVAQGIATANWGADACNGSVTIEWGTDAANINARSYWANPASSYDDPDLNIDCRIVFNAGMSFTWPKFCTVLVHEYGHLTGHPHTVDGGDVMSPIYRAPLPACLVADPSAAPAPAPEQPASAAVTAPVATSAVADAPAHRSTRHAATRAKRRSQARPRARTATLRLHRFSDEDAEPLPWAWVSR